MKKWIFSIFIFMFLSPFSMASTDVSNHNNQAKTVIENWFAAMKNQQFDKAAGFLAPQFVSIHTDGIVRNKQKEMSLIRHLNMKSYKLANFKFSQSGNVMVVTYKDQGSETIDKEAINKKPAGRMAVLQRQNNKWLILAYANLDQIG